MTDQPSHQSEDEAVRGYKHLAECGSKAVLGSFLDSVYDGRGILIAVALDKSQPIDEVLTPATSMVRLSQAKVSPREALQVVATLHHQCQVVVEEALDMISRGTGDNRAEVDRVFRELCDMLKTGDEAKIVDLGSIRKD